MSESYVGDVVRKRVAAGSKSDHSAVVLETDGAELILRRQGGNAFHDSELDALVGRRIRGTGRRSGNTLVLAEWQDVAPAPATRPRGAD